MCSLPWLHSCSRLDEQTHADWPQLGRALHGRSRLTKRQLFKFYRANHLYLQRFQLIGENYKEVPGKSQGLNEARIEIRAFLSFTFNDSLTRLKIHLLIITSFMKKLLLVTSLLGSYLFSLAQIDTTKPLTPTTYDTLTPLRAQPQTASPVTTMQSDTLKPIIPKKASTGKKDWSKVSLANRSNDHFMVQLGYDKWAGKPDSIKTKGFAHSINVYFMLDFPFKTDQRFSVGLGAGVSGSSTPFDKTIVQVAGAGSKLVFKNVADTNYFKKFKLSTVYAEIPIELRFATDPENNGKSWKFALGGKVGTMINAHTKGKNLLNKSGNTLNAYTMKESSKRFFNSTRLAATARVGIGVFSLFGVYQINSYLKEGAGPEIHPYSIGLTLSGL